MDTISTQVRSVLFNFGIDIASVTDDNELVNDLGLDSIELIELAQDLEEEFDIEIPDSAITAAMTVGQVVDAVKNLKGVTS
jgi:acyl carrier protein